MKNELSLLAEEMHRVMTEPQVSKHKRISRALHERCNELRNRLRDLQELKQLDEYTIKCLIKEKEQAERRGYGLGLKQFVQNCSMYVFSGRSYDEAVAVRDKEQLSAVDEIQDAVEGRR